MKTIRLFFLTLMMFISLAVSASQGRDPYTYFFEMSFGDFPEELQRAKKENKKAILIFFEAEDCPFCHRMKDTVLNQPLVQKFFRQHFLSFAVDVEGDVEVINFKGQSLKMKEFAEKENRVRATPVFAFFNLQGDRVVHYTGATSGIEEFLWLGEYVAQEQYREMSFTKYKRERRQLTAQ